MQSGVVLTNVQTIDQLDGCVRRGGYNAVKVITGWGVDVGGWNRANIHAVCTMVPNVVVRTVTGDPSYRKTGEFDFVDPNRTFAEITPWYSQRPDIIIELGNEPTEMVDTSDDQIHRWAYTLNATIDRCRLVFPLAKLIAPAVRIDAPSAERFLRIGQKVMARCEYIGMHAYEHYGFAPNTYPAYTGIYDKAVKWYSELFPQNQWYLTEYGINDPGTSAVAKGTRYGAIWNFLDRRIAGALYYHLAVNGKIDPQYNIYPKGDKAVHDARYVS
jgi:hypothetical protein